MTTTVQATSYGDSSSLTVTTGPTPEPGPGQVRVAVRAIGTNPIDHKVYGGMFGRDPGQLPMRLGFEAAGVVAALGEGVTGTTVGDEVIVHPTSGSYTSDLVTDSGSLTPKPAALPWEQAAGLMSTGTTAWHVLDAAGLSAGDVVLVHGAAGGVGQLLLQLARLRGIAVVGTASERNHPTITALGATPIAYGDGLLERARDAAPQGYAAALDLVGTDEAVATSLALAPAGRTISIAAFGVDGVRSLGGGPGADPGTEIRDAARPELARLAAEGDLEVVVDRTFPLDEAGGRAAHDLLRTGHAQGKIILLP